MTRQPKVAFVSLGCPKNLVDSEKMLGTLAASGFDLVTRRRIPALPPKTAQTQAISRPAA